MENTPISLEPLGNHVGWAEAVYGMVLHQAPASS